MPYANSPEKTHFVCPNCGADVPPRALACPECGADENAGWNESGYAGEGSAGPEDSFDYREAFDREFGDVVRPEGIKPIDQAADLVVAPFAVEGNYADAWDVDAFHAEVKRGFGIDYAVAEEARSEQTAAETAEQLAAAVRERYAQIDRIPCPAPWGPPCSR